jgi:hypothetical protein
VVGPVWSHGVLKGCLAWAGLGYGVPGLGLVANIFFHGRPLLCFILVDFERTGRDGRMD